MPLLLGSRGHPRARSKRRGRHNARGEGARVANGRSRADSRDISLTECEAVSRSWGGWASRRIRGFRARDGLGQAEAESGCLEAEVALTA